MAPGSSCAGAPSCGSTSPRERSARSLQRFSWSATGWPAQIRQELEDAAEALTGTRRAADPAENEGKAALVYHAENESATADLAGVCTWLTSFLAMPVDPVVMARAISVGSGRRVEAEELLREAERVRQLERALNVREGLTRLDDTLPGSFLGQSGPRGKERKAFLTDDELERMKDDYYARRGWDLKTGTPTRATLERFELQEVAEDLARQGKLPGAPDERT